jgi:hypothetical protein
MAIMMIMTWKGATLDQYREAKRIVDWENAPAAGGRMHATAHDGESLRITDVWDSAEQFQAFVNDRLMPGIADLGMPGQPDVEIYPLEDLWIPAGG